MAKSKEWPSLEAETKEALANFIIEAYHRNKMFHSCVTCRHFENEGCALADGARPPATVIVEGCPAYEETAPF